MNMKKKIIIIALIASVIANIILVVILIGNKISNDTTNSNTEIDVFEDISKRKEIADSIVKKCVCDNLFYPDSYDPVNTQVDSAFSSYMTDMDCLNAAVNILRLRKEYQSAKNTYETNDWTIRFHGNPKGAFLERERKERDEAKEKMKDLERKIEFQQEIIRKRDTSRDGHFVGWSVVHRFRSSNNNGIVNFTDVLVLLDPQMTGWYYCLTLDESTPENFDALKSIIEEVLAKSSAKLD